MRLNNLRADKKNGFTAAGLPEYILALVNKYPLRMLTLAMLITSVFVYFPFLFQGQVFIYSDIGSDTQNVYYPFFVSMARKIANGDFSMWNFEHGMGTNLLTRQSDVTNVFTWIACLLGSGGIKYGLVYAHILKIFITGYICYFYLDTFKFSTVSKTMAAYVYAFNGFTVLWGQHYTFGTACLYIVLMLFAIEKSFRSGKGYLWVAFATFTVMRNTYYLAYMVLLVAALYALFRLAAMYSVKELGKAVKRIGGLLAAVTVGGCMSAAIFLPSVALILGTSSRVTGGMSLMEKLAYYTAGYSYDETTVQGILSRLFSNNLMGTQDYTGPLNYYEMPQWFFTSFTVFVGVIFVSEIFLNKQETVKSKALKLTGTGLMCALAFHPLLSFLLNGFVSPFFRYTYVVMPFLALCYAETLDKLLYDRLRFGKLQIACAGIISVSLLLFSVLQGSMDTTVGKLTGCLYLAMMAALVLVLFFLGTGSRSAMRRNICILCVVAIFAANVCAESYVATNARTYTSETNPKIYLTNGNDEVRQALDYIEENETAFCRTEKIFKDVSYLNDSMLEGYYGVSVYNSVINQNIVKFVTEICPEFKSIVPEGYYDFLGIWNNTDLTSLLGVKYVLSYEDISYIPEYTYVESFGELMLFENTKTDGIAQFFTNAISYEAFAALDQEAKRQVLKDTLVIQGQETEVTGNTASGTAVSFEKPSNSSHVIGTVDARQDGWVFLPIPNEIGWSVYVDGEEAELLLADMAFCAVAVTAGEHTVEFRYSTPLLKEGIAVSCIGFILFGVWSAVLVKKTCRRKKALR